MATKKVMSIPKIVPPTEDELRARSARWIDRLRPCLYENWPQSLKDLSFRTTTLEISREEVEAILDVADTGRIGPVVAALGDRIHPAIEEYGAGGFVRLSSRSPKDAFLDGAERVTTGREAVELLLSSMRVFDDLCWYRYADSPCLLLVREFHKIPPREEFRCFFKGGKVAGVTQYHYDDVFPGVASYKGRVFAFLDEIAPLLPLEDVVVDVWAAEQPTLIEINPYGLSDPCLLSYEELEGASNIFRILEDSA